MTCASNVRRPSRIMPQNHIIIYVTYLAVLSKVSKVKQKKGKKTPPLREKKYFINKAFRKTSHFKCLTQPPAFYSPFKSGWRNRVILAFLRNTLLNLSATVEKSPSQFNTYYISDDAVGWRCWLRPQNLTEEQGMLIKVSDFDLKIREIYLAIFAQTD